VPANRNNAAEVSKVLNQLHDSGVLNLDKSVRDMLNPAEAVSELQSGTSVATAVSAWDGYGVVIKSALDDMASLANVAGQLRQVSGGEG
jgi:hypothetical protein